MPYPKQLKNNTFLFSNLIKKKNFHYNEDDIKIFDIENTHSLQTFSLIRNLDIYYRYSTSSEDYDMYSIIKTKKDYQNYLELVRDNKIPPFLFAYSEHSGNADLTNLLLKDNDNIDFIESVDDSNEDMIEPINKIKKSFFNMEPFFECFLFLRLRNGYSEAETFNLHSMDEIFIHSKFDSIKSIILESKNNMFQNANLFINEKRIQYMYFNPDYAYINHLLDFAFTNSFEIDRLVLENKNNRSKGSFLQLYSINKLEKIKGKFKSKNIELAPHHIYPYNPNRYYSPNANPIIDSAQEQKISSHVSKSMNNNVIRNLDLDVENIQILDNNLTNKNWINNIYFFYKFSSFLNYIIYFNNPIGEDEVINTNIKRNNIPVENIVQNNFLLLNQRLAYISNIDNNDIFIMNTVNFKYLKTKRTQGIGIQKYVVDSMHIDSLTYTLTLAKLIKYYLLSFKEKHGDLFGLTIDENQVCFETYSLFPTLHFDYSGKYTIIESKLTDIYKYVNIAKINKYINNFDKTHNSKTYTDYHNLLKSILTEHVYSLDLLKEQRHMIEYSEENNLEFLQNDAFDVFYEYVFSCQNDLTKSLLPFKRNKALIRETPSSISSESFSELKRLNKSYLESIFNYIIDKEIPNIGIRFENSKNIKDLINFIFSNDNGELFLNTYMEIYQDLTNIVINTASDISTNDDDVNEFLQKKYNENNLSFFEEVPYYIDNTLKSLGGLSNPEAHDSISRIVDTYTDDIQDKVPYFIVDESLNDEIYSFSTPDKIINLELSEEE